MEFVQTKRHYIMALAIMFVVVSLSGTTYSLFLKADTTENFTYTTGTLDLEFTESEQIYIQNALPVIDSDGMKSEPYTLTIKNKGTLPYQFDLKMLSSTEDNLIDMKYIKYQVNDKNPTTLYQTNNIIASNVLLFPEEEISFKVKVWLDISTPNGELGKTFMAKLVTTGQSVYKTLDTSGANRPDLNEGMIPVYYDDNEDIWKKADESNMIDSFEWYNYDNSKWANVVTINNSFKQIYDITGNNHLSLDKTRTNNGNYVTDETYLDLNLSKYSYNNISSIFRIKFNDLKDNIYIMSNENVSYYYDITNKRFVYQIGNTIVNSETYDIERGKWYILGFTYDKKKVKFYIDGNNISTNNMSDNIYSNSSFKIGTDTTTKKISNMEIGDIYIYNSILTNEEIKNNYKTNINVIYNNLLRGYNDFVPRTLYEYYTSSDLGTIINNKDISSYYVWIPRFKYKLWNVTGTAGIDSYDAYNKGIEIAFEKDNETSGVISCENNICYSDILKITKVTNNDNGKYYTHPAFKMLDKEVTGLWVSKYEISTNDPNCNSNNLSGCISSKLTIESKIGNNVWRNNYISNFYQNIKSIGNNYHMMKNTEWGAITYLTHSKYGLCKDNTCKNIGTNNTYISGNNIDDSTTKNMYGIFDLSGSASEYVMANYSNTFNNNFQNITISNSDYDIYQENTFILGDATKEISLNEGIWHNNYNSFINETNNWLIRGGIGTTSYNGIFYYNATTNTPSEYITTRIVIK